MATSNATTTPQYDQDIPKAELGTFSPGAGRSFQGPADPALADFAERMLRHAEEYAAGQAEPTTAAPEAELQSLDAIQQDQIQTQQGREEGQALHAIQQDRQARDEASSLQAMHPTQAANDNQQRALDEAAQAIDRDGREELFAPSAEQGQENNLEANIERDGREELFQSDGPEPDNQEQSQEQEQVPEQQMEMDH